MSFVENWLSTALYADFELALVFCPHIEEFPNADSKRLRGLFSVKRRLECIGSKWHFSGA